MAFSVAQPQGSGLFYDHDLKRFASQWIERVYPELWGHMGYHHQAIPDLELGERNIVIPKIEAIGRAGAYSGKASDVPLFSSAAGFDEYKTMLLIMRFEVDQIADLAPQAIANRGGTMPRYDIESMSREGVRRKIAERENELVIFGNNTFKGWLNQPLVPVENITAGTNLHTIDPAQLYTIIAGLCTLFKKRSLLTAESTKLFGTTDILQSLHRVYTDGSGNRPIDLLQKGSISSPGYIREAIELNELSYSFLNEFNVRNLAGSDREIMVLCEDRVFESEEEALLYDAPATRHFMEVDSTEPRQSTDTAWSTTMFSATSEVIVTHTHRMMYIQYDKAT